MSTHVNDQTEPVIWVIQAFESSSCGQRSAISCHLLSRKFEFPGSWLKKGPINLLFCSPSTHPSTYSMTPWLELRE
ncbi:hypothetical protein DFH09DRAFT_1170790 [Mycena vulgaris]|nr:hypothetical protein DFH09DRAFT_1170790 [Mycena vulgaris]